MVEALDKPQIIAHIEKGVNYTLFDVKWLPCSAKLVVLGSHPKDTGALQLYEVSKGELKKVLEVCCIWSMTVLQKKKGVVQSSCFK